MDMVKRFDIWLVSLNPAEGSEMKKTRPCVVVSPDAANKYLKTVVIIPLTSSVKAYPTRVQCHFQGKNGELVIDQIRSIDKVRLVRHLGNLDLSTARLLCDKIVQTFHY
jgi:mRNA interferase MazF